TSVFGMDYCLLLIYYRLLAIVELQIEHSNGRTLTFGQLEAQAHSLARAMLVELKVTTRDQVCAIYSESTVEYGVSIAACLLLGITYMPVAPGFANYEVG